MQTLLARLGKLERFQTSTGKLAVVRAGGCSQDIIDDLLERHHVAAHDPRNLVIVLPLLDAPELIYVLDRH